MKNIPKEFITYVAGMVNCLKASPNTFLIEEPGIIQRLEQMDWPAVLGNIHSQLITTLAAQTSGNRIGTLSFQLDDNEFEYFSVGFSQSNEFEEWPEFNDLGGEIGLAFFIREIFPDRESWDEDLQLDLELFQRLFLAMMETVAIESMNGDEFKALPMEKEFIITSRMWHDVENSLVFDASGAGSCYRQVDDPPLPQPLPDKSVIDSEEITLFGSKYKLDARVLHSDGEGRETVPVDIGLLQYLQDLNLTSERIKDLPESFFDLLQLEKLNLSQNRLTAISSGFGNLTKLVRLDLSNNKLRSIPKDVGKLIALKELLLEKNELESLPHELRDLVSLEMLSLVGNRLETLGALPKNLAWLNLFRNNLEGLPDSFADLKNLESLVLSENRFQTVPLQILSLKSLTSLDLGGNPIEELPFELNQLSNLNELRVYPNRFSVEKRAELKEKFGEKLFVGYDTDENSFME